MPQPDCVVPSVHMHAAHALPSPSIPSSCQLCGLIYKPYSHVVIPPILVTYAAYPCCQIYPHKYLSPFPYCLLSSNIILVYWWINPKMHCDYTRNNRTCIVLSSTIFFLLLICHLLAWINTGGKWIISV